MINPPPPLALTPDINQLSPDLKILALMWMGSKGILAEYLESYPDFLLVEISEKTEK